MKKWIILGISACLLVLGCSTAYADRVKGDDNPIGIGEQLNFNSVEFIRWDEPCWLRVGEYHPVYGGFIPDLKEAYDSSSMTRGGSSIDIYVNGKKLHKEVERSVVWRDDRPYPLDLPYPDEYDTKFTWYFVQFPAGYFEPGIHDIVIVATAHSPNSYIHEVYGTAPVVLEIELHVSE